MAFGERVAFLQRNQDLRQARTADRIGDDPRQVTVQPFHCLFRNVQRLLQMLIELRRGLRFEQLNVEPLSHAHVREPG